MFLLLLLVAITCEAAHTNLFETYGLKSDPSTPYFLSDTMGYKLRDYDWQRTGDCVRVILPDDENEYREHTGIHKKRQVNYAIMQMVEIDPERSNVLANQVLARKDWIEQLSLLSPEDATAEKEMIFGKEELGTIKDKIYICREAPEAQHNMRYGYHFARWADAYMDY